MAAGKSIKIPCVCEVCGTAFSVYPADIRKGGGLCCSTPCRNRRLAERNRRDIVESFWAHVDKTTSCWLWTGGVNRDGYGQLSRNRTTIRANRLSWEIHYGVIPPKMLVLHDCPGGDNPRCIHPDHLWLGTDADNNLDCAEKNRQAKGERCGSARLTESLVVAIRVRYAAGDISCQTLADEHHVSRGAIQAVIEGRSWRHLLLQQVTLVSE